MSEYSKDAFLGGLCTHKWFANGDRTQGAGCLDAQKHPISVYMYAHLCITSACVFAVQNPQLSDESIATNRQNASPTYVQVLMGFE